MSSTRLRAVGASTADFNLPTYQYYMPLFSNFQNLVHSVKTLELAYQIWQEANFPSVVDVNIQIRTEQQLAGNREQQSATNTKVTGSTKSKVKRPITSTSNGSTKRQPANNTKLAINSKSAETFNSNLTRATKPITSGASKRRLMKTK
jgi:hypothetical protein